MLPTSRYMGGIARPKDLRVITRSTGASLERLKAEQPFCGSTPERVSGSSRDISFASPTHAREFHTSSRVPYDSSSYNETQVPEFLVRYKQERPGSFGADGRNTEELGLMPSLTDSILSGDVVATTRRLKTKVPVEHHAPGGQAVHTSGYVVPGPGHTSSSDVARAKERERNESSDWGRQKVAITDCVREFDLGHVDATTLPSLYKVPLEVRESDGSIKHPSGFIPPTPIHKFRYHKDIYGLSERKASVKQKARQVSPGRGILRTMHTTRASGDS